MSCRAVGRPVPSCHSPMLCAASSPHHWRCQDTPRRSFLRSLLKKLTGTRTQLHAPLPPSPRTALTLSFSILDVCLRFCWNKGFTTKKEIRSLKIPAGGGRGVGINFMNLNETPTCVFKHMWNCLSYKYFSQPASPARPRPDCEAVTPSRAKLQLEALLCSLRDLLMPNRKAHSRFPV